MPYNKGDFTQQGVNGHVNANVRLNEKRLVNIDMTINEEAEGCTIVGTVKDLLNDKVYNIGSGGGGGGDTIPKCTVTIINNLGADLGLLTLNSSGILDLVSVQNEETGTVEALYYYDPNYEKTFVSLVGDSTLALQSNDYTDLTNISVLEDDGRFMAYITDPSQNSALTFHGAEILM